MKISKTEQDYLKLIYELADKEQVTRVTLKYLVQKLSVAASTVTEMVKRLERKNLVEYESYKGVSLTAAGIQEALFIMKSHRIWEYFLLEKLHYQEDEVHIEAEILEHAASPMLIERLYAFLGRPEYCPHGNTIPKQVFWFEHKEERKLSELEIGMRATVSEVSDEVREYWKNIGIEVLPTTVHIVDRFVDKTVLVQINSTDSIVMPLYFQKQLKVIMYQVGG